MITVSLLITPRFSASSIIAFAIRSSMLAPGLLRSSFIHTSALRAEEAVDAQVRGVADRVEDAGDFFIGESLR